MTSSSIGTLTGKLETPKINRHDTFCLAEYVPHQLGGTIRYLDLPRMLAVAKSGGSGRF
jgi:hypothetical protein